LAPLPSQPAKRAANCSLAALAPGPDRIAPRTLLSGRRACRSPQRGRHDYPRNGGYSPSAAFVAVDRLSPLCGASSATNRGDFGRPQRVPGADAARLHPPAAVAAHTGQPCYQVSPENLAQQNLTRPVRRIYQVNHGFSPCEGEAPSEPAPSRSSDGASPSQIPLLFHLEQCL